MPSPSVSASPDGRAWVGGTAVASGDAAGGGATVAVLAHAVRARHATKT
jgi:hypothetical protein